MAAVTPTIHSLPSAGSYVRKGTAASFNDADTIDTGLPRVSGMIIMTNTADTVCSLTSQSAGVATIAARTAAAAASGVTLYWEAWHNPRTA